MSSGMPPLGPIAPSTYSTPSMVTGGISAGIVEEAWTMVISSGMDPTSSRVNHR